MRFPAIFRQPLTQSNVCGRPSSTISVEPGRGSSCEPSSWGSSAWTRCDTCGHDATCTRVPHAVCPDLMGAWRGDALRWTRRRRAATPPPEASRRRARRHAAPMRANPPGLLAVVLRLPDLRRGPPAPDDIREPTRKEGQPGFIHTVDGRYQHCHVHYLHNMHAC